MQASYETISIGLDQLFFSPLVMDETPEDRSDAVETFLLSNGWTWDMVLDQMTSSNQT